MISNGDAISIDDGRNLCNGRSFREVRPHWFFDGGEPVGSKSARRVKTDRRGQQTGLTSPEQETDNRQGQAAAVRTSEQCLHHKKLLR